MIDGRHQAGRPVMLGLVINMEPVRLVGRSNLACGLCFRLAWQGLSSLTSRVGKGMKWRPGRQLHKLISSSQPVNGTQLTRYKQLNTSTTVL